MVELLPHPHSLETVKFYDCVNFNDMTLLNELQDEYAKSHLLKNNIKNQLKRSYIAAINYHKITM